MGTDIMAESQTETVLAALDRGEADDKLRDQVSAALLRALTRITSQLDGIRENLWTVERLEQVIDRRHESLCSKCPLRQQVPVQAQAQAQVEPAPKRTWFDALVSSDSIKFFILSLLLVWAIIYVKTGPAGVEAGKGAAVQTVTGAAK